MSVGTDLYRLGVLLPAVPRCPPGEANRGALLLPLEKLVPKLVHPWAAIARLSVCGVKKKKRLSHKMPT